MTADESNIYYHAWNTVPGVSMRRLGSLLCRFGNAKTAWQNAKSTDLRMLSIKQENIEIFLKTRSDFDPNREIDFLQNNKIAIMPFDDPEFPPLLGEITDPPILLYCRGNAPDFLKPSISVVGTRVPTSYGEQVTRVIVKQLVDYGFMIVSGFACGVDQIAHETALDERGSTMGVLGSGVMNIYPTENRRLIEKMMQAGTFISEYSPYADPVAFHFPERNRLISGLSLGTVIVEASERSGALITAQSALDQNREVFAVPGNITSSLSSGTNKLIKNSSATPVSSADDIVKTLGFYNAFITGKVTLEERNVLEVLKKNESTHVDNIMQMTSLPISKVNFILTSLLLKGLVEERANYYKIIAP